MCFYHTDFFGFSVLGFTPVTRLIGIAPSDHLPVHLTQQPASSLPLPFLSLVYPILLAPHEIFTLCCSCCFLFSVGCPRIVPQLKCRILACCVIFISYQMILFLVSRREEKQHFLISSYLSITEAMEVERGPEPIYTLSLGESF